MRQHLAVRFEGARALLAAVLVAWAPGCTEPGVEGDGGGDGGDGGGGEVELRGPCGLGSLSGSFTVERQEAYSVVDGQVFDGQVPAAVPAVIQTEGSCVLLEKPNPFCDPPCSPDQTCDLSSSCIPFPLGQDLGPVTIRGLNQPVEMAPRIPGNHYFDTNIAHPVFDPGAVISLTAPGGEYGPFELAGLGVDPLVSGAMTWLVKRGSPVPVSWEPPVTHSRAQIDLQLTIDQHGSTPMRIECDFPDTGQAEIPAAFVDALFEAGISGFPNGSLVRRTVDSQAYDDGCAELSVTSPLSATVNVEGHVPCSHDTECPEGLTCDEPNNTCISL